MAAAEAITNPTMPRTMAAITPPEVEVGVELIVVPSVSATHVVVDSSNASRYPERHFKHIPVDLLQLSQFSVFVVHDMHDVVPELHDPLEHMLHSLNVESNSFPGVQP